MNDQKADACAVRRAACARAASTSRVAILSGGVGRSEKRSPAFSAGLWSFADWSQLLKLHTRIAAAVLAAARRSFLFFRNVGDQRFGGQHQSSDRSRVLKGSAGHLGRIDHAGL